METKHMDHLVELALSNCLDYTIRSMLKLAEIGEIKEAQAKELDLMTGLYESDTLNSGRDALKEFLATDPSVFEMALFFYKFCNFYRAKQRSEVVRALQVGDHCREFRNGVIKAIEFVKRLLDKNISFFIFEENAFLIKDLRDEIDTERQKLYKSKFNSNIYLKAQTETLGHIEYMLFCFLNRISQKRGL